MYYFNTSLFMPGKDTLITNHKIPNNPELPDLGDLIDIRSLEKLLDDFYQLTGLGSSVIDAKGNVLAGVGRQRICMDFHWSNSETYKNCRESDLNITSGLNAGDFNILKCKNNLWDVATPIIIENQRVGNLFLGQFLIDEEPVNEEVFRNQARKFGFDEKKYLGALSETPRMSRSRVISAMNLMVGFANMISDQSMNNILLRRALKEKNELVTDLQASQEKFRATVYSILDGVISCETDGTIESMNKIAFELTGWSEEEAMGKKIDQILVFSENPGHDNFFKSGDLPLTKEAPGEIPEILLLLSRSGQKVPVSLLSSLIQTRPGKVIGRVFVIRDQSAAWDKKLASDAREKRISRQRALLAKLSVDKSVISGDIDLSKKIIAEIASEAMQTDRVSIWLFSDDGTELNCIELYQARKNRHSEGYKLLTADYPTYFQALGREYRINSPDVLNDPFLSELTSKFFKPLGINSLIDAAIFSEGKLAGVVCFEHTGNKREWLPDDEAFVSIIATLITQILINADRTRTYEALKDSLLRNQALIDSIPDLVFLFSKEGVFMNFHSPGKGSLYVEPEQFMNKPVDEVLPAYLADLTHENLKILFKTGRSRTYEYEMDDKGKARYFDARMVLCGEDKAMTIVREITQQKNTRRELMIAKERAEESDRLKSAFLANMSHEIRTPMNGIIGFAGLLKRDNIDKEKKGKYIDIITSNADHLLNLINDIIDISKIESGDIELHEEVVDLQLLFEDLIRMFYDRKPGVEIRFVSGNLPVIIIDKLKLTQVISNLIGNAIKFTDQGYVEYSVVKEDNMLVFGVEDSGQGIADKDKDIIFDRFAQGGYTPFMSRGGTGLGLAIAKAYTEKMGGRIWFNSIRGKGSTFYFSVPYVPAKAKEKKKTSAGIAIESSLTILVAEDDDLNYLFIEEVFSGYDIRIIHARDGNEAIKLCYKYKFDLVLMDIKMPVMNGLEATKIIKKMIPELPVIAVSAHAFWTDHEKAFDAGCDDYITKPLQPEELTRKIKNFTHR